MTCAIKACSSTRFGGLLAAEHIDMNMHCGDKVLPRDVGGSLVFDMPQSCGDCSQADTLRTDGCGMLVDKGSSDPANLQLGGGAVARVRELAK